MSTTIDERVLSMQFDNKHFERNVQTSLGTLDKLKQSLNLVGAAKGLENINTSVRNVNMSPLIGAVETVGLKFNAMYTIADQALRNITNIAMNAGKNIVNALAIDPIKTGFSEYETKIGSIQTIMSNTASKGTTMADVTRVIDELNTYADKTIYNFAEMTRNIGTFTAAGVGLEESASAIQGIANLAAASGSTSQQASTAMYQLSQALAAGTVKLIDWNSVVNAGMGGEKFQEALKATARDHGIAVDDIIKKNGSFRDSLQEGWISADILNETLNKFTIDGAEKYAKSMMDAGKWTQEQADALVEEARSMDEAATKVKTFTQLWDTLKESAQSGWGKTWELIVGDFEDAKEMWSGVSKALGGIIDSSSDRRNNLIEGTMTSNWDKMIKKINEAGIETSAFEKKLKAVAEDHGYNVDALVKNYGSLEEVFRSGAIKSNLITEALKGTGKATEKTVEHVVGAGDSLTSIARKYGTTVEELVKLNGIKDKNFIRDGQVLKISSETISENTELTDKQIDSITDLASALDQMSGRELLMASFKNIFEGILSVVKPIKEAFSEIFPPLTVDQLYNFIEGFKNLTDKFKLTDTQSENLKSAFKGLFSVVDIGWTAIKKVVSGIFKLLGNFSGLGDGVLSLAGSFGKWLTGVRDSAKETDIFGKAVDGITGFVQKAIDKIKQFGKAIKEKFTSPGFDGFLSLMKGIWEIIKMIGGKIGDIVAPIGEALVGVLDGDNLSKAMKLVNSGLLAGVLIGIKGFFKSLTGQTEDGFGLMDNLKNLVDNLKGIFDTLADSLTAFQQNLKAGTLLKIAGAIGILAVSILIISSIDPAKLAASLWTITALFGELLGAMAIFEKIGGGYRGATKAAAVMTGMSIAVLILAGAVKTLSSVGWEGLAKGLVGVGVLMAEIALFLNFAKFGKKSISTAIGIVILSGAIKILASACKDFSQMNWGEIGKGLVSIGALLLEVAIFTRLSGNAKHVISTGIALVAIAAGLKVFASAVKDFATVPRDDLGKSLLSIAFALAEVAIATWLMPNNMISIGIGLAAVSGALIILADAVKRMSGMTWDEIGRGLVVLGGSMLILAVALRVMQSTISGSFALLVAAGALAVLSPVLKSLGSMSIKEIGMALVALAGAFVIIGIAGLVLGPLAPTLLALAGAIALVGVAAFAFGAGIALVATGLGALAGITAAGATAIVAALTIIITGIVELIPTIISAFAEGIVEFCTAIGDSATAIGEAVKNVVLALVDVFVECVPAIVEGLLSFIDQLLVSLAEHTPSIVDSLMTFLISLMDGVSARMPELVASALNLVTSFFTGLVDAITAMDASTLANAVIGVGIMAGAMAIFGMIGPLTGPAMTGVLGMSAVVAEMAVLIAAFGALAQIPGLTWLVEEGGTFLTTVGNAIGGFLGGIVGGIAEGFTASLPQIGTDLSTFMTNLSPFIEGAKGIDATMMTGVESIVGIITALTAANVMEGLTSWITGGSSLTTFAAELPLFGAGLKSFADSVAGIDGESITTAATAAQSLAAMAATIPNEGGLLSLFAGENSMSTFAAELPSFGAGLKGFADNVSGIDAASVTAATTAAQSLATMAATIPNEGGLLALFAGENSMASFATELPSFGSGLKGFADNVSGIDSASVSAATTAAGSLVELANLIPNQGGLLALFTGDNSMSTFATELKSFGTGLNDFGAEVDGMNTEAVTTAVSAADTLVELANKLPESGGLWSVFSADNDMSTFASEIKKFGGGIADFAEEVADIDTVGATSAINLSNRLKTLGTSIPEDGGASLSTFGSYVKSFGSGIKGFATNIAKIDSAQMSSIVTSLDSLVDTMTDMGSVDAGVLATFDESLKLVGTDGIEKFISALKDAAPKAAEAGRGLMDSLIKGLNAKKAAVNTVIRTLAMAVVTALKSYQASFYVAGQHVATGFANGISANTWKAEAKARAMANAAAAAAKRALDEHSPSKVFYGIGDYAGLGFVNALDNYVDKAYRAGSDMATSAKDGLSKAISKVYDVFNSDMNTQPTIRPVVDLSAVTAGAGAINGMFGINPSIGLLANVGSVGAMVNRSQNGGNHDVISAIKDLGRKISDMPHDTYNVNGVTYDDGSNVSTAVKTLVRAAKVERRI